MIAGMHRSGTSYLAKSLSLLGLRLPKSIRPGSFDNPKGHYESFDIAQYHERLLSKMDLSWDTFISLPEKWFVSEQARQAVVDLCERVKRDYPGDAPIVLKDPRLSLFLPVWRKVAASLAMHEYFLISFRHPFEVAASLNKRNKISKKRALLVWLTYLLDAEKYSRGLDRTFVCFPLWTKDIERSVEKIELDLGIEFPEKCEESIVKINEEYEKGLVHHDERQAEIGNNDVERIALDVYSILLRLTVDPNDAKAINEIDGQRAKLRNVLAQKRTFTREIYRSVYRAIGLSLRKSLPPSWVDSIKRIAPDPLGVPGHLKYKYKSSKEESVSFEELKPATSSPDIIILSIFNWSFRYQRPQHIATGLADTGRRVFYVEMEMEPGGIKLSKISNNLYRIRLSGRKLGHIQPYTGRPSTQQTKQWLEAFYQFCDAVGCTPFKQIIIQHPFWWNLARHLSPEYQIIFDCMDDISGFSNADQDLLDLERDLLDKCDRVIVSSQYLFDKYKHYQEPALIRNAADLNHFDGSQNNLALPEFIGQDHKDNMTGVIRVGYVGAIEEWFDAELLREVAVSCHTIEFHLCGAVTEVEAANLEALGNIWMYGEISYSDVPGFIHAMDVMIIPFKIKPIIQACDPVKFYEYSAMGKPTVTTALPELVRASDLTFVATTAAEFTAQIHSAYEKGKIDLFKAQLRQYAADNTWAQRISCLDELLTKMPKVTIVILGYGDPSLVKGAVHSLCENGPSYPNMEILVVDNGSAKEALNETRSFVSAYPNVSLIENGENLGFAKGNNVGLGAAAGEYVMLLNNDTIISPGAVNAMVRHLELNPAIGAVGPLTNNIGNEAKIFVEYQDMKQMRQVARDITTGYRGMYTSISVVAYFAVMFRRKDLEDFGLLSEEYGLGMFEDDDHCAMIKSKGYLCALAEDAFVHHEHSASFSEIDEAEKEGLFEKNREIYEKRWGVWEMHKYREERPVPTYKDLG